MQYKYNTIQYTIQYNTIYNTQYNTIHNTIQYNIQYTIQYTIIQYTIQYNTIQCNTIYNTIQYNTQYNTIQYNAIQKEMLPLRFHWHYHRLCLIIELKCLFHSLMLDLTLWIHYGSTIFLKVDNLTRYILDYLLDAALRSTTKPSSWSVYTCNEENVCCYSTSVQLPLQVQLNNQGKYHKERALLRLKAIR